MSQCWFYTHEGKVIGPVAEADLRRLVDSGALVPDDQLWPESAGPHEAVAMRAVLDLSQLQSASPQPEWLADIRRALQQPIRQSPAVPDWVADVAAAEAALIRLPAVAAPTRAPAPAPAKAQAPAQVGRSPQAPPGTGSLQIDCGGASSVGRIRERNEDRFLVQQWIWNDDRTMHQAALLVVADGMGGYQAGDLAASLTVRTIATQMASLFDRALAGMSPGATPIAEAIDKSLKEANRIVHLQAQAEAGCKGMGATAAVALIWDNQVSFSHVGDCRVYLHRRGKLRQLTEDQTLVARMVALGRLTSEEAAEHPSRNEVLQALGKRVTIEPSQATHGLECGDRLLLACDGLAADVADEVVQKVMNRDTLSAGQVATTLVAMAGEEGGIDNCTVLVAQLLAGG